MIDMKNVIPAEIGTLQDVHILTVGGIVDSDPLYSLPEKVDSGHT